MRDPKSDPVSSLEIHLHRLEKLENNQRKQRRNFLALAIATLVAVGGLWFMKPQQGPDTSTFVVFSAKQFQENEVTKVLNEENSAVVLVDYDSHMRDTLTKLEDFENWVAKNQVKYATQEVEELEETPDLNHGQPSTDIQAILLIVGKKIVNKRLVFAIKGYDPAYSYTLDFDNGYVQEGVGQRSVYAYNRRGSYTVGLIVQASDGRQKEIYQEVEIKEEGEVFAESSVDTTQNLLATREIPSSLPETNGFSTKPKAEKDSSQTRIPAVPVSSIQGVGTPSTSAAKAKKSKVNNSSQANGPLQVAKQMPSFPGGQTALYRYIEKNLIYPQQALDKEVEGRIYVQFVVQPDGQLTDTRVVRSLGYGCDQEALRIISNMPRWNPGYQNGQKVAVFYTLPINYEIN